MHWVLFYFSALEVGVMGTRGSLELSLTLNLEAKLSRDEDLSQPILPLFESQPRHSRMKQVLFALRLHSLSILCDAHCTNKL